MKDRNIVRVKLYGELGNQMFEIAFALALSKRLKAQLEVDDQINEYRLQQFKVSDQVLIISRNKLSKVKLFLFNSANYRRISKNFQKILRFINKFFLLLPKIQSFQYLIKETKIFSIKFTEHFPHAYDNSSLNIQTPVLLDGYFQSWKYFEHDKLYIKNQFRLKNISRESKVKLEKLPKRFTAVHVRRGAGGPAVLNPEYHGLLSAEYYNNAVIILKKLRCLYPIVIFTDNKLEFEKLVELLDFRKSIHSVIAPNDVKNQAENMWIMTHASSFIGANSSYSWWSAYLIKKKNSQVVFPRPWYREPGVADQDLLLPEWLSLGFSNFLGDNLI